MGRRTLLLIAALVVAVLGTAAVFVYAQNAKTEGTTAQQLVTVLVAKSNIAVGTTGSAASANGAFTSTAVRAADVVPGALSDATPIAGLVATIPVFPGQQIISAQWGATALTSGLTVAPGQVAVSVQLGDPQRVAGFLSPGSEIAVIASGLDANQKPFTRTLLSKVAVIGVGPTTVVSKTTTDATSNVNTEQISTAILTLSLSQTDAEKLVFAQGTGGGQLYFALMTKDSKVVPNAPGITAGNLFK
ncbi:MAG TPA: Flp pilus assembly protein CpaB [Candidatus Nanopelagicales bacterium]|jgi:pilus assembly protein CpaB